MEREETASVVCGLLYPLCQLMLGHRAECFALVFLTGNAIMSTNHNGSEHRMFVTQHETVRRSGWNIHWPRYLEIVNATLRPKHSIHERRG